MNDLEEKLQNELLSLCEILKRKFDYMPDDFIHIICQKGPVEAAASIVNKDKPSEIFLKLLENKKLNLTIEAWIIKPEYQSLFNSETIKNAIKRLQEYKYFVNYHGIDS